VVLVPTADPSIAGATCFAALAVILLVSFLVPYLATDLRHVSRGGYIALLAAATGTLTWAYLWTTGTDASEFLTTGWGWGILGAVLSGGVTGLQARRWPARGRDRGAPLAGQVGWEGLVYGATEATLLSILPVLAVWQGGEALGWTDGLAGAVAVGALALVGSAVVIAVHHLGYREFRGRVIRYPILACSVFSLAYLLTGSVVAAIGGHMILHVVMIVRGSELPPHRTKSVGFAPPAQAQFVSPGMPRKRTTAGR
jgi:hypothetical protein